MQGWGEQATRFTLHLVSSSYSVGTKKYRPKLSIFADRRNLDPGSWTRGSFCFNLWVLFHPYNSIMYTIHHKLGTWNITRRTNLGNRVGFIHNRVITSFQWMVHWWVLGHINPTLKRMAHNKLGGLIPKGPSPQVQKQVQMAEVTSSSVFKKLIYFFFKFLFKSLVLVFKDCQPTWMVISSSRWVIRLSKFNTKLLSI